MTPAMPGMGLTAALAALAGLAHAASFAPWGHWLPALLVLAVYALGLLWLIRRQARRRLLFVAGFAFGIGWFLAGVSWLFISMHTYGAMPAPLAGLALLLFAGYLALFPATAATVLGCLAGRRPPPASGTAPGPGPVAGPRYALGFAATLTVAELARGWLFTGFPWLAIGYPHVDGPLAGFAPVLGVYGSGFMAALVAGSVALLVTRATTHRRRTALLGLATLGLGLGLATIEWSQPSGAPLAVRLVQGNVPQSLKFEPTTVARTLQAYRDLATAAPAGLTVLPETAWTMPWTSTPPEIAGALLDFVRSSGTPIAIGMPLAVPAHTGAGPNAVALSNSVLLLDRDAIAGHGPAQHYDKRHLVPFGEFVPWGFRWFVDLMTIPLGDFARGHADQPPFRVADQRIAFNICYEDVFGEELQAAIRRPDGATILANVSNIGWFGRSHALPQHLQIARMRSLEAARPTIRSTNTGVTAAIDHRGTVIARLPDHEVGTLAVSIQGRSGLTPYTRTGNLPVLVIALAVLAPGAFARRTGPTERG